jgi:hypothetical protein
VARIESAARGATLQRAGGAPNGAPISRRSPSSILGVALDPRSSRNGCTAPAHDAPRMDRLVDETQRAGAVDIAAPHHRIARRTSRAPRRRRLPRLGDVSMRCPAPTIPRRRS